ncbi:MAG: BREX-2 system phosphatase PglZ [Thiocapsa sp.]|uniref:BREX-2 system phosphatase PglZ n=1 Tax=Thiocapsa sp. TaxID=2024551 RepID=UPI001BCEC34B|nr:BREX-2 system phosphatase PglZ [Thiocapsa sp.]QVL47102.1 MAG: BREX-2 system phosphatase PglZ [Thiocapsa sp.]
MVPSTRQIQQQVATVIQRDAEARTLAIHAAAPGAWPERIKVGPKGFRLVWCESPLAAREALLDDTQDDDGLVLLTGSDDQCLGADLLARLARGRVFRLQSWELVRDSFQARDIDPRLGRLHWIADWLVEHAPSSGYPPAPGGFLSGDLAWGQVMASALGIGEPRPDALTLVEWTLRDDASGRFQTLADPMRADVADWLTGSAGPAGRPLVACIAAGRGVDCLPIGLVCELIFRTDSETDPRLSAAARLERFTEGQRIERSGGRGWATAALAALERLSDPARRRAMLARADLLLDELGLGSLAESSDVLQAGLEARLLRYAQTIEVAVATPGAEPLRRCEAAAQGVLNHRQAVHHPARCRRVTQSLRLLRWLASLEQNPVDVAAAAADYAAAGSFVDWARMVLIGGDELADLSAAFARLTAAVRARRERFNRRFADLLVAWNTAAGAVRRVADKPDVALVPVEDVIVSVLAPLTAQCPALLLVADGMSLPVLRALAESLVAQGWMEVAPREGVPARVGVAMLPTLTEGSRASLLCGRRTLGLAAQEKTGFGRHPDLLAVSRATARPVLFHKSELGDGSGLADGVREALRSLDIQVVGVVYNAVDDHLGGSDQLHQTWSVSALRLLGPLLHEARLAGRALLITADHGHVLDEGATARGPLREPVDGDRWRRCEGAIDAGEIELSGDRVLAPGGLSRVILPWSEGVRYAGKKTGYHGGITPQEVLVPLLTLVPAGRDVAGWVPVPPLLPPWWEASEGGVAPVGPRASVDPGVPLATPAPPAKKGRKIDALQSDLFAQAPNVARVDDWVERLMASPVYAEQKRLAARIAPSDEELRRFLLALGSRGGVLGKSALARELGMPMVRIGGFLSAVRRVLNLDRAAVVSVDEAAGAVTLNRDLLKLQFQIKDA